MCYSITRDAFASLWQAKRSQADIGKKRRLAVMDECTMVIEIGLKERT